MQRWSDYVRITFTRHQHHSDRIQAERVSAVSCFAFIAAYQNGLTTETLCLESVKSPTLIVRPAESCHITCLREGYRVKRILKKTSSWSKMRRFTVFITAVCVLILYWFTYRRNHYGSWYRTLDGDKRRNPDHFFKTESHRWCETARAACTRRSNSGERREVR